MTEEPVPPRPAPTGAIGAPTGATHAGTGPHHMATGPSGPTGPTASGPTGPSGPTGATTPAPKPMPRHIFFVAAGYLLALMALFVVYETWSPFRHHTPQSFGQLPVGVVWFGAVGAVVVSLNGIFMHNDKWDPSYNYWHYLRPFFGAVTGSIGALIYLVLLNLGNTSAVHVDRLTFYVVAFVFGFADKSFLQLVKNVTNVILKPGQQQTPKGAPAAAAGTTGATGAAAD